MRPSTGRPEPTIGRFNPFPIWSSPFGRLKSCFPVGSITKRPVRGLSATTQGQGPLAGRQRKFRPVGVDQPHFGRRRASRSSTWLLGHALDFDDEGAVFPASDRDTAWLGPTTGPRLLAVPGRRIFSLAHAAPCARPAGADTGWRSIHHHRPAANPSMKIDSSCEIESGVPIAGGSSTRIASSSILDT